MVQQVEGEAVSGIKLQPPKREDDRDIDSRDRPAEIMRKSESGAVPMAMRK